MKRARKQAVRPSRRNPLAKAVREGIYRKKRVVEKADTYKRRPKHPKPPADEPDT